MRKLLFLLMLSVAAWGERRSLSVRVDLNAPDLSRPLRPKHELAFQLEGRPPGKGGAPGGELKVYRMGGKDPKLMATLRCPARPPEPAATVKATGYLYRQLYIWPNWRKAGPGHYTARYQKLRVYFEL